MLTNENSSEDFDKEFVRVHNDENYRVRTENWLKEYDTNRFEDIPYESLKAKLILTFGLTNENAGRFARYLHWSSALVTKKRQNWWTRLMYRYLWYIRMFGSKEITDIYILCRELSAPFPDVLPEKPKDRCEVNKGEVFYYGLLAFYCFGGWFTWMGLNIFLVINYLDNAVKGNPLAITGILLTWVIAMFYAGTSGVYLAKYRLASKKGK